MTIVPSGANATASAYPPTFGTALAHATGKTTGLGGGATGSRATFGATGGGGVGATAIGVGAGATGGIDAAL